MCDHIRRHDLEGLKRAVDHGLKINDQSEYSYSLLHIAVDNIDEDIVKFLLKRGADVNSVDYSCRDALYIATRSYMANCLNKDSVILRIIKMLLDYGSDPDRETGHFYTSRQLAEAYGLSEVTNLFVSGVSVKVANRK